MRSSKLPVRTPLFLALLPLFMTASACAPSIRVSSTALPCRELLEASGLLNPTPGATRPLNDTAGEIAAFGDRQTGQVDKANADKQGARDFIRVCDEAQRKAVEEAQERNKRKFLGLF
jgi:hypothetical protein